MGAKQSKLDKLHELYIAELTRQLREPETNSETGAPIRPTAALLAVIGNTLSRAGVKPTDDSPAMNSFRKAAEDLPFRTDDTPRDRAN